MRFHFDLTDGRILIRDDEGVEALDPDEALRQARIAIREMHGSGDLDDDSNDWRLVIRDAGGMVRGTIDVGPCQDDPAD